jgi:phenylacetate-coenzyme A ligase PaaK-like adenylate-forming protein
MAELRVRAELGDRTAGSGDDATSRLQKVLLDRLRIRTTVEMVAPGSMARTEAGKVKRVFEQFDDVDPLG